MVILDCNKMFNFKNFLKFQVGAKSRLNEVHFFFGHKFKKCHFHSLNSDLEQGGRICSNSLLGYPWIKHFIVLKNYTYRNSRYF
jgi:hypothetical protein